MARTKASVGAKISSGKSNKARCCAPSAPSSSSSGGNSEKISKSAGSSGGNPVCPRETPAWQKPITNFFAGVPSSNSDDKTSAGPSSRKSKKNVIESDEEEPSDLQPDEDESDKRKHPVSEDSENVDIESRTPDQESQGIKLKELQEGDDIVEPEELESPKPQIVSEELELVPPKPQIVSELEPPKNQVLDESIILEPLTGENSRKIDEYYQYKNKGEGKKSKWNKENVGQNKNVAKRGLEEVDDMQASKKVKIVA